MIREPIAWNKHWQTFLVSNSKEHCKKVFVRLKQPVLMRIKMRWFHLPLQGTHNLCANLCFNILRVNVRSRWPIVMKVSVDIHQRGHLIARRSRPPAVENAFAGKRQVQSKVSVRMRLRIVGNLGKPRAWDHEAGRVDAAGFERVN